jgi:hypothetical protein
VTIICLFPAALQAWFTRGFAVVRFAFIHTNRARIKQTPHQDQSSAAALRLYSKLVVPDRGSYMTTEKKNLVGPVITASTN